MEGTTLLRRTKKLKDQRKGRSKQGKSIGLRKIAQRMKQPKRTGNEGRGLLVGVVVVVGDVVLLLLLHGELRYRL